MKKYFFRSHKKSTALVVSIAIHVGLAVVASILVAVSVFQPKEVVFEPKEVTRPHKPLKKLQIPVNVKKKQAPKPKLRKNILAKVQPKAVKFTLPEMTGVKGGTGFLKEGSGLGSLGFNLGTLFGGDKGYGNQLEGTFYDLKQTTDRKPTGIGGKEGRNDSIQRYIETVRSFVGRGWKEHVLKDFYKVKTKKYTSTIMMPKMSASAAPEAFDVADLVEPSFWLIHYKGEFRAPEAGRYRFCGSADNVLVVRVGRKVVLDGSIPKSGGSTITNGRISYDWESEDPNNGKFPLGECPMMIGEWITMKAGEKKPIEVLVGEIPGGHFSCQLLIEKKGASYRTVVSQAGTVSGSEFGWEGGARPVLPVFKLDQVPEELRKQMKINPSEATLDGPTFGVIPARK